MMTEERPTWIPVSVHVKPALYEDIWLLNRRGNQYDIAKGYWNGESFKRRDKRSFKHITHWMPVSGPSKGEENG